MGLTGITLRRNSAQLDADRMCTLFEVCESMTIPACAAEELASTAERTAGEAQPEVLLEVAF